MNCASSDSAAAPFSGWPAAAVETASDMRSWRTSASAPRTLALCSLEVIVERDRRLAAHRRALRARADDPGQLAGAGALHDRERPGGLLAVERAGALDHEASRAAADATGDPLEADELRRLVLPVAHEPLGLALPFDVAAVGRL